MSGELFMYEGKPLTFALADGPRFEEIREIVESEGGLLKTVWQPGAIHLADAIPRAPLPFPKPQDHAVYSYHFIIDSQNLGELQERKMYELGVCDEDEKTEAPSNRREFKTRAKFTAREEEEMRKYMNKYPGPFTSVSYWMKATAYGLPVKRSPDTLRDHYKRMQKGKTVVDVPAKREAAQTQPPMKRPKMPEAIQKPVSLARQRSPGRVNVGGIGLSSPSKSLPPSLTQRSSSPRATAGSASRGKSPGSRLSTPGQRAPESVISELINTPVSLSSRFENTPKLLVTVTRQRGRVVQDMDALKRKCLVENIPEKFQSLVQRCQQCSKHPIEEAEVLEVLLKNSGNADRTEDYFARNYGS